MPIENSTCFVRASARLVVSTAACTDGRQRGACEDDASAERMPGADVDTHHASKIAPLAEAVPPRAYGGTERGVVHRLTEELVVVSISDTQRRPMPPVNWVGTVHP